MTTEALLFTVLAEILATSPALAALEPRPALGDDHDAVPGVSLVIECQFTGRSIEILDDYSVEITLSRPFRDEATDRADWELLWAELRSRIDAWYTILPDIPSLSHIAHLTIDGVEQSGSAEISGDRISRSLTLAAFIQSAS